MRRSRRLTWLAAAIPLLLAGCYSGPLQENPVFVRPAKTPCPEDNPLYVPLGPRSYGLIFEKCLTLLHSLSFEIARSNRFDGYIETFPAASPGLGQPWKGGSPDFYQRLLATLQSYRERVIIQIDPSPEGGYWVDVKVFKELEDVPVPGQLPVAAAIFQSDPTVERQYEVVQPGVPLPTGWIPFDRCGQVMRDHELEQLILKRLADFDLGRALKKKEPPVKDVQPCP